MNVQVEAISKEIIKPSSPTPNHLRHYKLSFLDQISPPLYTSVVLFYEFNRETQPAITETSKHLKKSLGKVLTLFYPLAGRVKIHDHFVECNDEGIPYLEAQVTNYRPHDVLNNLVPDELNKFIPFSLDEHIANEFALGVQLNMFDCGGFAIGLCISHKLADGLSMLMFTKTWAAIARGETDEAKIGRPQFVSATLFPPKEITGYDSQAGITKNKVTKRFVFDASTIEDLRAKYTDLQKNEKHPSRVETLLAFMWRRIVGATKADHDDDNKMHRVIYTVNLRPRIEPPLPQYSFGNICRISLTAPLLGKSSSGDDEDQESCYGMVRRVREALSKVDKDMKTLQHGGEHLRVMDRLAQSSSTGEVVTSSYASLCQFPVYDIDFGWGRPTWVGLPPLPINDLILFLDTKEAGGIEAYVTLSEEVMTKFESDPFLRQRVNSSKRGWFGSAADSSLIRQPALLNHVTKFIPKSSRL